MFSKFDEEAQKVMVEAKREMQTLKHPYVGSEHLMLAILKGNNDVSKKLKTFGIDYKKFKNEIINIIGEGSTESDWFLYTPLLKRTLESAVNDAKEVDGVVTISNLFYSILEEGEGVAIRIMLGMNVDMDKIYSYFSRKMVKKSNSKKKLLLEELGTNLNKLASDGKVDPVIGRENEINRILEILCRRTKNNPILIGEAGVGKTAIVEELASRIVSGDVPDILKNKKIISLDMASSVAGTKYRGEFEDRMKKILNELEENEDIILFIDEIHTIMGAGGAEGAIDASNIFKPALARGKMRCIGATTRDEYKKFIENDGALDRRFQKVEINEPDEDTIKDILMKLKTIYERHHEVSISEKMIDKIIFLGKKYIKNRREPDRSIDILDEVCSRVSLKKNTVDKKLCNLNNELKKVLNDKKNAIINSKFDVALSLKENEEKLKTEINNIELKKTNKSKVVTLHDIIDILKNKVDIPLLSLDSSYINNMEKILKETIIGQDKQIDELLNISKINSLNYNKNKCISLLFAGSTGTGKTMLAKTYGKLIAGDMNVIKLDMSEYSEPHSISKIIGAPPGYVGYSDSRNVLEEIKDKPTAVLILDEIERCNKSVLNLFLQILDEGYTKDSLGRKIYFDNVTIIMTSNIGFNKNCMGFNNSCNITSKLKDILGVEFINRISKTITFNKITESDARKIICNGIEKLRCEYKVKLDVSDDVIDDMVNESNYSLFGARRIKEIVRNRIENVILDELMNDNKNISIDMSKDKACINN